MQKKSVLLLIVSILFWLLLSCNLVRITSLPLDPTPYTSPQPTSTLEIIATYTIPPPEPTEPLPEPIIPITGIIHNMIPPNPVYDGGQIATDCNTGSFLGEEPPYTIRSGCDAWPYNAIERPMNRDKNIYTAPVDIIWQQFGRDQDWFFLRIATYNDPEQETLLNGTYAVEIDLDIDGRGDVMIKALAPSQNTETNWSVEGVEIWMDINDDVGGEIPVRRDASLIINSNGYETLVFDQGMGEDPDLAWVRISPLDSSIIEFAFKPIVLDNDPIFLWWVWASLSEIQPDKMDYVDHFSEEMIYQIDNTCRWIFGQAPYELPNICVYEQPTPQPVSDQPDEPPAGCWVRPITSTSYVPPTCNAPCPDPCPAGYQCTGSCTP
jgi:hypothetical protein